MQEENGGDATALSLMLHVDTEMLAGKPYMNL